MVAQLPVLTTIEILSLTLAYNRSRSSNAYCSCHHDARRASCVARLRRTARRHHSPGDAGASGQRCYHHTVHAGCSSLATTAPTRSIEVAGLPVAYRSFGHGPALVLTGCLGLSMDDWDPALLDQLALQHTIVLFDADGIGRTLAVPHPRSPLPNWQRKPWG